jgi:hypothetical protein
VSESEFGAGVVVCLVKFSEHVGNEEARRIGKAIRWINAAPLEREKLMEETDPEWVYMLTLDEMAKSSEEMLDRMIITWASGAKDHFYDLDRETAPSSLIDLANLLHELSYIAVDNTFRGEEEWLQVLALWSASAMDLDERLGLQPEWGEW